MARHQGTVVLEAVVRKEGKVDVLHLVRSLGFGLDRNAIEALKEWRFRPAMKNAMPGAIESGTHLGCAVLP